MSQHPPMGPHGLHPTGRERPTHLRHLPTRQAAERRVIDAARVWFDANSEDRGGLLCGRRIHAAESALATALEVLILLETKPKEHEA